MKTYFYLILVLFTISCTPYKEVEFLGVQDYSIEELKKDHVDIKFVVKVNNPNSYKIAVKATSLDLFINKKKAGKAKMTSDVVIRKKTEDTYSFVVRADYKEFFSAIGGSLGSAFFQNTIKLGVKGKVKAKAAGLIGKKFDLDLEENFKLNELIKGSGLSF